MRRWILPPTLLLSLLANAAPGIGGTIEVTVADIRSSQGRVHVDVCPEASFLKACPWTAVLPAQRGTMTILVRGVPPGRYAVQAFQDANANGELDQGIFGIPKEGVGFSNDAMARLVRPKFTVAAFDHGSEPQRIAVKLRYFLG